MSDLFADLLKGVSPENPNKKTDSNLSLNEKMSTSNPALRVNANNGSNLDLDFLDTYMTNSSLTVNASKSKTILDDDEQLLTQMTSSKVRSPTETKSLSKPVETTTTANLLDDFFTDSVEAKSPKYTLSTHSSSAIEHLSSNVETLQQTRDAALAELLDMGFTIERATNALEKTESGCDVNSAISYLMESAPKLTSRKPQSSTFITEESDIVNEISSNIMSTAAFLFNSGKKTIQQGVELYRKQTTEKNQGTPRWMKNQQQYKVNSLKPSNWDESEDEMNDATVRDTLKQQRENGTEKRIDSRTEIEHQYPKNTINSFSGNNSKPSFRGMHVSHGISRGNTEKLVESTTFESSNIHPPQHVQPAQEIDLLGGFSSSTTHSSARFNVPSLDSAQKMTFTHSREIAQENFKTGDFTKSLECYIEAGNVIPSDHPYQIIICSNLALLYSKLGNAKEQLNCTERGLKLITDVMNKQNVNVTDLSNLKIEDEKDLKSFWSKLMLKKAESLEVLEKWNESKLAYETLIKNGENSKVVMEGKNRCNKVLNPPKKVKSKNTSSPSMQHDLVKSIASEKLQRVKEFGDQKKREEDEKFRLHDIVEAKLATWRKGNEDNIRALICSLDNILWPELNWKPVKLTDLVMDNKVKINYMKAVAKTHPDKVATSESTENKMIANGVFITLNEAWEKFKQSKGL